jgi:BirA family biotin operon repressor/biotin-[acetyl-CoA-carboxylase] ligase
MIIRKLSNTIRDYTQLASTNDEMNRQIMAGDLEEGYIIRTEYQSAGKGHSGNAWKSEKGSNLLFSMLLKPDFLSPGVAFHLSRITSLSLYEILDNQRINSNIKWPNDMMVKDHKIAGILIENMIVRETITHTILGIGINVNQTSFDRFIPAPTSLAIEKGCQFDMNELLVDFRNSMERWYNSLLAGNEETIMAAYKDQLYRMGLPANYRSAEGEFDAIIRDVLPSGELVLESEKGEILTFGFKEVEYLI